MFKVGDRVQAKRDYRGLVQDQVYTVYFHREDRDTIKIARHGGEYSTKHFRPVVEAAAPVQPAAAPAAGKQRFFISVERNGELKPAPTPTEYATLEQAETVAMIMAEKHKEPFYVFVGVAKAEPPQKATLAKLA